MYVFCVNRNRQIHFHFIPLKVGWRETKYVRHIWRWPNFNIQRTKKPQSRGVWRPSWLAKRRKNVSQNSVEYYVHVHKVNATACRPQTPLFKCCKTIKKTFKYETMEHCNRHFCFRYMKRKMIEDIWVENSKQSFTK